MLLLGSVAACGLVIFQATRLWLAQVRIGSQKLATIQQGAALEPGNADAWDRLGRFQQWDFQDPDPEAALLDYQRAVREEPQSPYYWIDLANAYEQTGDIPRASEAYERARADYPISAEVAWQYGNFLLRQGHTDEGLKQVRRAVGSDSTLLPLAISRVWLSTHDVNVLLNVVLPLDVGAYFKALDFFQSIHETGSALVVWNRLLSLGKPFPPNSAFSFLDSLIGEDRSEDARKVWLEALHPSGTSHNFQRGNSLIWDGGFTQDFAEGGLGWRWRPSTGVSIDFDAPRVSDGTRSIRLDFGGGNNTDLGAPFQFVPVEPNRLYRFHAYMRTQGITTESGPRFLITDPNHPNSVSVATTGLTGSNPWTPEDADVSTGSQTHFLLVQLYRSPSRLFENKLAGTVWIAEISLVPSDRAAEADKQ